MKSDTSKPAADAQRLHSLSSSFQVELEQRKGGDVAHPEEAEHEIRAGKDFDSQRSDRTGFSPRHPELLDSRALEKNLSKKGGWVRNFKKFFSRPVTIVISVIVLIAVIAGSVFAYQQYQAKSKAEKLGAGTPPVVTVTSAVSRTQTVEDTLSVTGSVWAWDPLAIGSEVSGLRITAINVEEGDRVTKGQVLATLNSALLRAQLEQAKARLQSSHANLGKAIQPNRPEDILALRAALSQAEAAVGQEEAKHKQASTSLGNAEVTAHRYSELARAGAISPQDAENQQVVAVNASEEVHNAEERIHAANSTVDQARQRLLIATRGGRMEDVQISRANVAEIKAQIQNLEEQIAQTIIRAPDDGLISRRDAHIGDITSAGTPMFAMVRLNRLELRAQVSDIDIAKIHVGQPVSISQKEDDAVPLIGKVRLVNPLVDPVTRYGVVRVDLPADAGLKQGMFVRGEIRVGHREAVTVPVSSLVTRNGESVVFKLDSKNRALSTVVRPGIQTEKFIEIREGLPAGQVVVAKGARFLGDRDVVRVAK